VVQCIVYYSSENEYNMYMIHGDVHVVVSSFSSRDTRCDVTPPSLRSSWCGIELYDK
jgi:hypothetical protein